MDVLTSTISYKDTGFFSAIVQDYLDRKELLRPFYSHLPNREGVQAAIEARRQYPVNRAALVAALKTQYRAVGSVAEVASNLDALLSENTFTVTTAHQPAIFTGTLYFIFKILHTIRLCRQFREMHPDKNFVPVFFMGSEDADLDELGKIFLNGEAIRWDTSQSGAVGRMSTKGLDKILTRIEGELGVQPYGRELMSLLRSCYTPQDTIMSATFKLIHALFGTYGLLVLIPDNPELKSLVKPLFEDDLLHQRASGLVEKTLQSLTENYKVQAHPRAINLFYLEGDIRQRIEWRGDHYAVVNTPIRFSRQEILEELQRNPGRFSPNVILRGLFQESILPNIAFIGGGGEMAYWLELKSLFEYYGVPYPVLVLRNSFLWVEKKWQEKMEKLGVSPERLFLPQEEFINQWIRHSANGEVKLDRELEEVRQLFGHLKEKAGRVDITLQQHIEALQARTLGPLQELEKKMFRAEKRKYTDQQRQLRTLHQALFPLGSLQERVENFMPYYAQWGPRFIQVLFEHSLGLEQEFVILRQK